MEYQVTELKSTAEFDRFYEEWSLTFLGVARESEKDLAEWLLPFRQDASRPVEMVRFSGAQMNRHYGLTGDSCYQDALTCYAVETANIDAGRVASRASPSAAGGSPTSWTTNAAAREPKTDGRNAPATRRGHNQRSRR